MKKLLCVLMLSVSIIQAGFAQNVSSTNSDKTFELPADFAVRKFVVDLGKGNKMQLEVNHIADIAIFSNLDSLLRVFLSDIEPFKDTLSDELTSKRIDYVLDATSTRKIRIQQFAPKGSSYAVTNGEPAALKLEQDTINFTGVVNFRPKYTFRKRFDDKRSYRLSIFINNISELEGMLDGTLNRKIQTLSDNVITGWKYNSSNNVTLKADPSISARLPKGYVAGGDYINIRLSVDMQNYKSYFVPSFSLGGGLILSSHGYFKREFVLLWEPNFFFIKDDQNRLKTYRNDFLTLTWGQGIIKDHEPRKESELLSIVSISYLVRRKGEFFAENTMRFGAGRLSLFQGKTKIEPAIYFNKFFKGVTPGIRWIQGF